MPHQKPRSPRSLEHAVALVIDHIGAGSAAKAAGKSEKLVYAWSDDHSDSLPNIAQAIAMDAACKAAGHGTPIADAYNEAIDYAPTASGADSDACVRRLLASVGRVCSHHEDALADGRYDGAERQEMVNHLYDARDRIDHCIDVIGPTQAEVDKAGNVTPIRPGDGAA